jgi:hypothetical protein
MSNEDGWRKDAFRRLRPGSGGRSSRRQTLRATELGIFKHGCLGFRLGRADHLFGAYARPVVIIGEPLLVVGEHGEALFELSKFTRFVGSICLFGQFAVFGRFLAILVGG